MRKKDTFGDARNNLGRGGEVAALARAGRDSALLRCAALAAGERVTDDSARVEAIRLLLAQPKASKRQKIRSLEFLLEMLRDDATTDAAVLAATELLLDAARGSVRQKKKKGGGDADTS